MRKLFGGLALSFVVCPLVSLSLQSPAAADTMGTCTNGNQPCRTDNINVAWCHGDSLNGYPDMRDSATWAIKTLAAQTVLTEAQAEDNECTDQTDVRFVRQDLGADIWGQAVCITWNAPAIRCLRATVFQSLGAQVTTLNDENAQWSDGEAEPGELYMNFQKTWCHEVGHTVGFWHHPEGDLANRFDYYDGSGGTHDQDCLVRGHIENANNWLRYNQHHRNHAENAYG